MTYIAEFDPEWADAQARLLVICPKCGWQGTREDCARLEIRDVNGDAESGDASICPDCLTTVWWDGRPEIADMPIQCPRCRFQAMLSDCKIVSYPDDDEPLAQCPECLSVFRAVEDDE